MARIVVSEFMDQAAVDALAAAHPTHYDPELADDTGALLAALADAEALIVRNRTFVDAAMLEAAPALRVVGRLGVGLDNIDEAACAARSVRVFPATGANGDAVAEYVVLAVGILRRGAFNATSRVANGEFPRAALAQGREMAGAVLGIVGYGDIGRRVARLAQAFGMRVLAHDPALPVGDPAWGGAERMELPALLAAADAVTLHVPLTEATRGLIGEAELAAMRPGAVLVNTARGGALDEAAAAAALRSGHLGGLALDVFEIEPLPPYSPFAPLAGRPDLILTPHVAGVTSESIVRVSNMIAERVLATLAEPR